MPTEYQTPSSVSPDSDNSPEEELARAGMDPSDAKAAAEAFEKWTNGGRTLRITSRIDAPIPLFRPSASFGEQNFAFDSTADFLAATKAKIAN